MGLAHFLLWHLSEGLQRRNHQNCFFWCNLKSPSLAIRAQREVRLFRQRFYNHCPWGITSLGHGPCLWCGQCFEMPQECSHVSAGVSSWWAGWKSLLTWTRMCTLVLSRTYLWVYSSCEVLGRKNPPRLCKASCSGGEMPSAVVRSSGTAQAVPWCGSLVYVLSTALLQQIFSFSI